MIFHKPNKSDEALEKHELGFEERERKTPFAGYVLLIAMTITSLMFGFFALDDLEDIPQKPEALSSCAMPFIVHGWQDMWRYGGPSYNHSIDLVFYPEESFQRNKVEQACSFSDLEFAHNIPEVFTQSNKIRTNIEEKRSKLAITQRSLFQTKQKIATLQDRYSIGLQERAVRRERVVYNTQELNEQLTSLEEKQKLQNLEIAKIKQEMTALNIQLKPHNEKIDLLYQKVVKEWRIQWRWYELWVFLLRALFVVPFFWIVLKWYFSLAAKNSPYAIIATFALIIASIFAVTIIITYFWTLFLGIILEALWIFIQRFNILKSLLSYFGMIASIGIFGGAVYFLQKKIFNPKRVALRRLRDYQCPSCQFSLKLAKNYCPHCDEHIMEKCSVCNNQRYIALSACPHCGDRKV